MTQRNDSLLCVNTKHNVIFLHPFFAAAAAVLGDSSKFSFFSFTLKNEATFSPERQKKKRKKIKEIKVMNYYSDKM